MSEKRKVIGKSIVDTEDTASRVRNMCRRHFLLHPLLPYVHYSLGRELRFYAPSTLDVNQLHFAAVHEMLAFYKEKRNLALFQYL